MINLLKTHLLNQGIIALAAQFPNTKQYVYFFLIIDQSGSLALLCGSGSSYMEFGPKPEKYNLNGYLKNYQMSLLNCVYN